MDSIVFDRFSSVLRGILQLLRVGKDIFNLVISDPDTLPITVKESD